MSLDPQIFEAPVRTDLIHTVVVAQLAARRRGTHATKNRALVSGGGSKPYRQKGTGRARQGTTRAGQFSGGGIVFGPQPRSYAQRVPKRIRKAALRSALSLRKSEDAVHVVESLELPEIKTRLLLQKLAEMGASDALVVTPERDRTLELASRNARSIKVLPVGGLNGRARSSASSTMS
jgi:large subunit ribosomal protein L4